MFDIQFQLIVSSICQWTKDVKSHKNFYSWHSSLFCIPLFWCIGKVMVKAMLNNNKSSFLCYLWIRKGIVSFELGKGSMRSWQIFKSYRIWLFQTDHLSLMNALRYWNNWLGFEKCSNYHCETCESYHYWRILQNRSAMSETSQGFYICNFWLLFFIATN